MSHRLQISRTARLLAPALALALALALTTAATLPARAQEGGEIRYEATELAPGLYMLEGVGGFAGGNIGLSVGEDGVVLIDDGLPPLTATLRAAIAKITKQPVDFVVNTHVHGDHTGGNEAFAEAGATIVAHDNLRARMVQANAEAAADAEEGETPHPKASLPVVTFSDAMTFHLNGHAARVFHVAAAHTDGDAVIHFVDDDVIHTGDVLFNGMFPFIDLGSGGSVAGYIAAQKRIVEIAGDATRIVAGHGPLADRDDVRASIAMLETAYGRVKELVAEGKSEDAIVEANPLADYDADWSWQFITTERMTRTMARDAAGRAGDGGAR